MCREETPHPVITHASLITPLFLSSATAILLFTGSFSRLWQQEIHYDLQAELHCKHSHTALRNNIRWSSVLSESSFISSPWIFYPLLSNAIPVSVLKRSNHALLRCSWNVKCQSQTPSSQPLNYKNIIRYNTIMSP